MGIPFLLKVVTENNKRFIISLDTSFTTNNLIKEVKKYFIHYYKISYSIKYLYTPDKFVIFDDLPLLTFFKSGDICYIKGKEGESNTDAVELKSKVEYDFSVKRFKQNGVKILNDNNKQNGVKILNDNNKQNGVKILNDNNKQNGVKILNDNNKQGPVFLKKEVDKNVLDNQIKGSCSVFKKIPIIKSSVTKMETVTTKKVISTIRPETDIHRLKSEIPIVENLLSEVPISNDSDTLKKDIASLDSPTKKKNNKNERNFNVKNGINPNVILKETKKKEIEIQNVDLKNVDSKNADIKNSDLKNADLKNADLKNSDLKNVEIKDNDKLFVLEEINNKPKEKPVLEIKGIKQVKKKKKINYEEL